MARHVSGPGLSCCPSRHVMTHVRLDFSHLAPVWLHPGLVRFEHPVLRSPPVPFLQIFPPPAACPLLNCKLSGASSAACNVYQ